ncbi:MAG: alkaline phosphatase family protein [Clostridia bacterium]|nr:alkaline phosphatase family protein [Clostridia bacterium]
MKMIFIFIDGFGLGEHDKKKNPIYAADTPSLNYIFENSIVLPTDASLGVKGLPQSATGQTAIFTGANASQIMGNHVSGQPTPTLKNIINNNSLFKELIERGFKVTNSNVYRDEYLSKILDSSDKRYRPSVTTVMCMSCGIKFRTVEDYKAGNGVYHDITGQIIKDSGYDDVELISPQEAARRLYNISRDFDFTLYEHFMTDIIGHTTDFDLALKEIELLDAFLGELISHVNFDEDIIFIASDHGNIEDISVKTHTYNKVPTIIMGKLPDNISVEIDSLIDIMPTVLKIFEARR